MSFIKQMLLQVSPTSQLNGTVTPPSSKSHTVRGLFIATLAQGKSLLRNALNSKDTQAAIAVCKALGAIITTSEPNPISGGIDIEIESTGVPFTNSETKFFSGDSGITTTFAIPIIGLRKNSAEEAILDCGEQMRSRPILPLIKALSTLGIEIKNLTNQSFPISLKDALTGGYAEIDGVNSQYLSSLLMSLPCAQKDSEIVVHNLHERPYVDMTLSWLDEQKIQYGYFKKDKKEMFQIKGRQIYQPFQKNIPGDFSSASYLIAAATLLEGEVTLEGLDMQDPQGDKKLIPILQQMGAEIIIEKDRLKIINKSSKNNLTGTTIDCSDMPDLVPTLAIIGTQAKGKTTLINAAHARIKETDRINSMVTELKKMGAQIEEKEDGMIIHESKLSGAKLHGYNDHRTIMALSLAGLLADGKTEIDTAEGIQKTFPNFVEAMKSLGARMEMIVEK